MFYEIVHILRYKLLAFIKVNVDWRPESLLKNVGSFVVYTGFTIGAFFFTRSVIAFLLEEAHVGLFLLHRFLSMLLYVFFLSINVGNIIVSYSTLYRSNEVVYLLTKPLTHTNLFIIKFLDNFFYSSTTLFLIGFSVLAGYGSYFGLSWSFYVWATLVVFVPFMFLAAIVGVLMLMGLMMFAQRVGPRTVILGLSTAYVLSIYAFFKVTNPMKLVNEVMRYYPNINQYFGFLDPPLSRFLPNHWVAESFYWTISGDVSSAVSYVALLLAVCVFVGIIALSVARRWYYASWLAYLGLRVHRENPAQQTGLFQLSGNSLLEPQTDVLIKKEFWQFFREPSQWIHLGVIVLLMAVFLASASQIDISHGLPFLQAVSFLVVFLFNAFLVSSVSLRFVYPLVSIEGEAFWRIRSAPVSLKKVAALKFGIALLLIFFVAQSLNSLSRPLTSSSLLLTSSVINAGFITLTMVSLCFGMGSLFATYKEKNPIRVASSQGASLTFLLTLIYLVFLVVALFVPVNRHFEFTALGRGPAGASFVLPTVSIGVVSAIVATLFYRITLRSLKRDF